MKLIKVGSEWINPAYVIRVWWSPPTSHSGREWEGFASIRMTDGSVVIAEGETAEAVVKIINKAQEGDR